jgi:hypothetical protein
MYPLTQRGYPLPLLLRLRRLGSGDHHYGLGCGYLARSLPRASRRQCGDLRQFPPRGGFLIVTTHRPVRAVVLDALLQRGVTPQVFIKDK